MSNVRRRPIYGSRSNPKPSGSLLGDVYLTNSQVRDMYLKKKYDIPFKKDYGVWDSRNMALMMLSQEHLLELFKKTFNGKVPNPNR